MISDNNSSILPEPNNKKEGKMLSKKTKRDNFKNNKKRKNSGFPSPLPFQETKEGKKTVYPSIRKKKKLQPKINDFFESANDNNGNNKNSLNENNLLNNNDGSVSFFNANKKYAKKKKLYKNKKNSEKKDNPNNINNNQNSNNKENNNISCEEKKNN